MEEITHLKDSTQMTPDSPTSFGTDDFSQGGLVYHVQETIQIKYLDSHGIPMENAMRIYSTVSIPINRCSYKLMQTKIMATLTQNNSRNRLLYLVRIVSK